MNRHRGANRAIEVKETSVNFVVPAKIVHIDQVGIYFHQILQIGANAIEDISDIFDNGSGLQFDVQFHRSHVIDFSAKYGVVR